MDEKRKVPEIRFKGFTDEWQSHSISEMTDEFKSGNAINSDEIKAVGKYPAFGGNGIRGYVNHYNHDGEYALIGRQGALCGNMKYSKGRAYFTEHAIAVKGNKNSDTRFLYYCLGEMDLGMYSTQSAQPGLAVNMLADITALFPSVEEQHKIKKVLSELDVLIEQQTHKYNKLQSLKQSLLQKMFPQAGARVPEIRFQGFTGEWKEQRLGDIVESYSDPVETPHDGYFRLGIRSHAKGTFHEYVPAGHELETAQMHRVAANKLIFNITFSWEHAVAITDENDAGKLVSHRFPQFTLSEALCPEFLKYVILDERFHHHLTLSSPGGAGRNRVLKLDEALNYKFRVPSPDEQHKIGAFFNKQDDIIAAEQQKLAKLQAVKQSLLAKMLV